MIIGTDSLDTCIEEGYTMMWYDARQIKEGQAIDPKYQFKFARTSGIDAEKAFAVGFDQKENTYPIPRYAQDIEEYPYTASYSLKELIQWLNENRDDIESYTDHEWPQSMEDYTTRDILNLADTLLSYYGWN